MKAYFIFLIFIIGFTQAKSQNKNEEIIPLDFPNNYIVDEWEPSAFLGNYVFYPDRTFLFIHGGIGSHRKIYDLGIWTKKNEVIQIGIYKSVGIRPVGEAINPDCNFAANPDDYCVYDKYEKFEEWKNEQMTFEIEKLTYEYCTIDTAKNATTISINLSQYYIEGKYKVASCRFLIDSDLVNLSKMELRIMRNEIFARYGYKFKSDKLKTYFDSKEWYKPTIENVDEFLTDIEKRNINFIRLCEEK